jgi:cysteine-rich repeat protein
MGVAVRDLTGAALALALIGAGGGCAPANPTGSSGSGPTSTPAPAICGNGAVESGEECDDADTSNDDECLISCYRPTRWLVGDAHMHGVGCNGTRSPSQLASLLVAEELDVGVALVWGVGYDQDKGYFTGNDDPQSTPGHILHFDMEVSSFPSDAGGHLMLLGLRSLSLGSWPRTTLPIVDRALAQDARVVIGMAHAQFWKGGEFPVPGQGCCVPWELPVLAQQGKIHFMETELAKSYTPLADDAARLWTRLQNAGCHVAIAGGSDIDCIHHFIADDTPQTHVIIDSEPSYEAWLTGLRQGRTAVAVDGPNRLALRVNGARLGDEVKIKSGDYLRVVLESRAAAATDVEIRYNGLATNHLQVAAGTQVTTVRFQPARSGWLVAASQKVITSPVYVLVDDKPIRASADDACYWVRYLRFIAEATRTTDLDTERASIPAYDAAREEFMRRFVEAGGTRCE